MPTIRAGSRFIGPRSAGGSSAPSDLPAYLASIGKASFYGGYRGGLNMWGSADTSSPVTGSGQTVRRWVPNWTAGGFSAEWTQSNSPKRPTYGSSRNGKPGIYGDGSGWLFTLNSITALNLPYTVLMSAWATFEANGTLYSHSDRQVQLRVPIGLTNDPITYVVTASGSSNAKAVETTPVDSTTAAIRAGLVSSGSAYYGTAPTLFMNSNGTANPTSSTIHECWLIGAALTPREISTALQYLL